MYDSIRIAYIDSDFNDAKVSDEINNYCLKNIAHCRRNCDSSNECVYFVKLFENDDINSNQKVAATYDPDTRNFSFNEFEFEHSNQKFRLNFQINSNRKNCSGLLLCID